MKKTLFVKTESDIVVIPKLKDASWLERRKHIKWVKKHFNREVQTSSPNNWRALVKLFSVQALIEENGVYRVEGTATLKDEIRDNEIHLHNGEVLTLKQYHDTVVRPYVEKIGNLKKEINSIKRKSAFFDGAGISVESDWDTSPYGEQSEFN
jgi:hypothetical protein